MGLPPLFPTRPVIENPKCRGVTALPSLPKALCGTSSKPRGYPGRQRTSTRRSATTTTAPSAPADTEGDTCPVRTRDTTRTGEHSAAGPGPFPPTRSGAQAADPPPGPHLPPRSGPLPPPPGRRQEVPRYGAVPARLLAWEPDAPRVGPGKRPQRSAAAGPAGRGKGSSRAGPEPTQRGPCPERREWPLAAAEGWPQELPPRAQSALPRRCDALLPLSGVEVSISERPPWALPSRNGGSGPSRSTARLSDTVTGKGRCRRRPATLPLQG